MRNAKKTPFILNLEKEDQPKMSETKTVQEVLDITGKPKEIQVLRALQESDRLIRNLIREGALSEESIYANQVLEANEKALG